MKLGELAANPRNPRKITDEARTGLDASMSAFGDVAGITFNRTTGHLVGGHQRVAILTERHGADLELEGDAVVEPDGTAWPIRWVEWDEGTEAAALLAANNRHLAGEFTSAVAPLLDDIGEGLGDLLDDLRLPELLHDLGNLQRTGWKPPKDRQHLQEGPPDSKPGEVYLLGPHRLACGDARDEAIQAKACDGARPALLLTDPPYGISVIGSAGTAGNFPGSRAPRHVAGQPMAGDTEPFDPAHLLDLADKLVLWGANHYADQLSPQSGWLIWDKKDGGFQTFDLGDAELAWTNLGGAARLLHHTWQGMYRAGAGERGARIHPTQKPVDLMVWCLERAALPDGSLVLDTYAGSGSTLMACQRKGHRAALVELEPRYCDAIRRRWTALADEKGLDAGPGALQPPPEPEEPA